MNSIPTKEGHPAPSSAPNRRHRRASLDLEQERSKIKEVDHKRLREKYFIIDSITMTIPGRDDRVLFLPSRCITFHEDAFDAGL